MTAVQRVALGSVAIGVVVVLLKYSAYYVTGSLALYSDALESIVNIVTSIVALIAIRTSGRQADSHHPYGYDKAEYFSAVLCGVLVVVAALVILHDAYQAIWVATSIHPPWQGFALNGLAGVVNAAWSYVLIRHGRRHRSPALVADGRHLLADVVTSAGVLAGVVMVALTGWAILDPVLAALVALHILWAGWQTIKEGTGGLLDRAASAQTQSVIKEVIARHEDGVLEVHDLRTRQSGRRTFVDFHLVVQRAMTVAQAHAICDRIEAAIRASVEDTHITIHVEPDDEMKHSGALVF